MRLSLRRLLSEPARFFFLPSVLLVLAASAASAPARADDCTTVPDTCLHEVIGTTGNSRVLTVTLTASGRVVANGTHFQVIVPGNSQFSRNIGGAFTVNVQPDGTAIYSVQMCAPRIVLSSDCVRWTQVTRHFASASACQMYTNAAMLAVAQSDSLACGYGGPRWDHSAFNHLYACLNFIGDWKTFLDTESNGRANDLAACRARIAAAVPCPQGQIRIHGNCQPPPVLPGTSSGNGGGFIQLTPACPDGQTYDAGAKRCVAASTTPPQGGGNTGVAPPTQQADGSCGTPGAVATVVINQPGLDKLNVRRGIGGQPIGSVPEGSTVTVVGPCGAIGGAGFAKPTAPMQQSDAAGPWCQISMPISGCVSAQFLQFGGATFPNDAAGLARQKGFATSASADAGFGGTWRANADNVAYTLFLTQRGSTVSGSYQGSDGSTGTISGTVSGNVLRFSWGQRDGTRGSGKFALARDGRSFNGSFSFSSNPDAVQGSWNGVRL